MSLRHGLAFTLSGFAACTFLLVDTASAQPPGRRGPSFGPPQARGTSGDLRWRDHRDGRDDRGHGPSRVDRARGPGGPPWARDSRDSRGPAGPPWARSSRNDRGPSRSPWARSSYNRSGPPSRFSGQGPNRWRPSGPVSPPWARGHRGPSGPPQFRPSSSPRGFSGRGLSFRRPGFGHALSRRPGSFPGPGRMNRGSNFRGPSPFRRGGSPWMRGNSRPSHHPDMSFDRGHSSHSYGGFRNSPHHRRPDVSGHGRSGHSPRHERASASERSDSPRSSSDRRPGFGRRPGSNEREGSREHGHPSFGEMPRRGGGPGSMFGGGRPSPKDEKPATRDRDDDRPGFRGPGGPPFSGGRPGGFGGGPPSFGRGGPPSFGRGGPPSFGGLRSRPEPEKAKEDDKKSSEKKSSEKKSADKKSTDKKPADKKPEAKKQSDEKKEAAAESSDDVVKLSSSDVQA